MPEYHSSKPASYYNHKIQQDKIINTVQKRAKKIPLAYMLGHTNFFVHDFIVTKDTLILG